MRRFFISIAAIFVVGTIFLFLKAEPALASVQITSANGRTCGGRLAVDIYFNTNESAPTLELWLNGFRIMSSQNAVSTDPYCGPMGYVPPGRFVYQSDSSTICPGQYVWQVKAVPGSTSSPYSSPSMNCSSPPPPPPPPPSGNISASPNPCQIAAGQTTCSTTISWSSSNTSSPNVCVNSGSGWNLFSNGPNSSGVPAPWIQAGYNYNFTLFNGANCTGSPLSSRNVTALPPPNQAPGGDFWGIDCNQAVGWAWDPDVPNTPIWVHIYRDGPVGGGGVYVDATYANIYNAGLPGNGSHQFSWIVPAGLKDGVNHSYSLYAVDPSTQTTVQLVNSPRSLTCAAPPPPNSRPTGSISGPSTLLVNTSGTYTATINDVDNNLSLIRIFYDGPPNGTQNWAVIKELGCSGRTCSTSVAWTPSAVGTYTVVVNGYDAAGAYCSGNPYAAVVRCGSSDYVVVTVNAPPPSVLITNASTIPCANGPYQVTLSWQGNSGDLWIDLADNPSYTGYSNKNVNGVTSTIAPDGFNPARTLNPGVTYYWRIWDGTVHTSGPTWNVPWCSDLNFADAQSEFQFYTDDSYSTVKNPATFTPGELMYVKVKVRNSGNGTISTSFHISFYLSPSSSPSYTCPPSPPNPAPDRKTSPAIAGLAAGAVASWQFTINAPPLGSHTAYAYADSDCAVTTDSNRVNNVIGKTYTIRLDAWFQTLNGDVGAKTSIATNVTTNPLTNNSSYLLQGSSLSNVKSPWKISNYSKPFVSSYHFFAERYLAKAANLATGHQGCSVGGALPAGKTLAYCSGNVVYTGTPIAGNQVWFIDGDGVSTGHLTIQNNLAIGAGDAVTFIVKGNVNVNTSVTRADGVYIVGETGANYFQDTDNDSTVIGGTLTINGAVYAKTMKLTRKLAAANTTTPAEIIVYDPKYNDLLNTAIGAPNVSWSEVAP